MEQATTTTKLINDFFSKTNANEVSESIANILDRYIENTEDSKAEIANNVGVSNKVISLLYNLESALKE